ncbi:condensation domain-containing protein, partial [Kibdelosporangium lantanae]
NTVPVRARLRYGEPFLDFLARLQAEQASMLDHQYLDLAAVTRTAGVGELFDTLLVIENYPVDEGALERSEFGTGLRVERMTGHDGAHYPVMLTVVPGGGRVRLELRFRGVDPATADQILGRLKVVLTTLVERPETSRLCRFARTGDRSHTWVCHSSHTPGGWGSSRSGSGSGAESRGAAGAGWGSELPDFRRVSKACCR